MNIQVLFSLSAAALLGLAGCAMEGGPYAPQDTPKYTVENTERCRLLDKATQTAVT